MKIIIDSDDKTNIRIDSFLKSHTSFSRNYVSKLINDGYVKVNELVANKLSYKTKLNDIINIEEKEPVDLEILPQNIDLNILYEDDDILIVDKERGMVVHPSNGHKNDTLVNAIMYHCKNNLSSINGVIRPGIVHRIDKDTSGLLCVCKNNMAHINISEQFNMHTNVRKYKAIVKGVISKNEGIIDKPIGRDKKNRLRMAIDINGKNAKTHYKVLERFENFTYVECELFTGRTHQIRVHMKDLGHPLLGDIVYGSKSKGFEYLSGQVLHAYYLQISHPRTKNRMTFESKLPQYFEEVLKKLHENKQ